MPLSGVTGLCVAVICAVIARLISVISGLRKGSLKKPAARQGSGGNGGADCSAGSTHCAVSLMSIQHLVAGAPPCTPTARSMLPTGAP
jgi:hypothetical protein